MHMVLISEIIWLQIYNLRDNVTSNFYVKERRVAIRNFGLQYNSNSSSVQIKTRFFSFLVFFK